MDKFDFYKKRDLGMYIADTFNFFKVYAKDFSKNFLIINGAAIATLIILVTFLVATNFPSIGMAVMQQDFSIIADIMWMAFFLFLLVFLVMVFVSCFPVAYAQLVEESPTRNRFSPSELLPLIKNAFGRMLLFGLISIFIVFIPSGLMYALVANVLSSIPGLGGLLTLVWQYAFQIFMTLFMWQAMLLYVKDKEDYFVSLSEGFAILKEQFWHKMGATAVMSIIVAVLMVVLLIVPYIFTLMGLMMGSSDSILNIILIGSMWVVFGIMLFIISNLTNFLQLIIHYSSKSNKKTYTEIDEIGRKLNE